MIQLSVDSPLLVYLSTLSVLLVVIIMLCLFVVYVRVVCFSRSPYKVRPWTCCFRHTVSWTSFNLVLILKTDGRSCLCHQVHTAPRRVFQQFVLCTSVKKCVQVSQATSWEQITMGPAFYFLFLAVFAHEFWICARNSLSPLSRWFICVWNLNN